MTKSTEQKVQRTLRKMKSKLTNYEKLYPTGSNPGLFYGLAKIHKVPKDGTIKDLPLRPMISNIGTATYMTSKYLANLLSPLATSEYTIKSTEHFTNILKTEILPDNYKNDILRSAKFIYKCTIR